VFPVWLEPPTISKVRLKADTTDVFSQSVDLLDGQQRCIDADDCGPQERRTPVGVQSTFAPLALRWTTFAWLANRSSRKRGKIGGAVRI
jgi:hypothetical protein